MKIQSYEKNTVLPIKVKSLWRVTTWFWNVLEKFIKAQIEGLDIDIFYLEKKSVILILYWEIEIQNHKKKLDFTNECNKFCVTSCGTIVGKYWKFKILNFEVRLNYDGSSFFGIKITYEFNNFHANDK